MAQMEATKFPTLHLVLFNWIYLEKHCRDRPSDTRLLRALKAVTREVMRKRFHHLHDFHYMAACLNPNYKNLEKLCKDEVKRGQIFTSMRTLIDRLIPENVG